MEGKNAFVTGGAGFIGSTLVRELLKQNMGVIVFDNFKSGAMENLEEVKGEITIIKGDVRDRKLAETMEKAGADYVFHLAAMPYIPDCYDGPTDFFDINAAGSLNVMLACNKAGVERAVQYSTSEVYGSAQETPMTEDHRLFPQSTYAATKLAVDRLCFTLHHEQGIPVVILRQFNCFGERATHRYIIPEIISQLSKSDTLKLGNVSARRDFTYVGDAAKAAIELAKEERAEGEVYNCGTGESRSIKEIAETIGRLMKKDFEVEVENPRLRPLDVLELQADYSKLNKLTGWKPDTSFEEGMKKTIKWFEENGKRWCFEK